ncbi:MAG TPA: hypothetical protein VMT37_03205 [Solirubrobacterales bacterium]|nr:hypothetical protein [Solirubrobacterales bacterium]
MRFLRPPLLLLAALALAVFAFSGCGGGGSDATTDATEATTTEETKPALTKAELIKQGDALCAETNTAVGSVGSSAAEPSSQVSQVANLYTSMVSSLEGLGNPKEGASEYMKVTSAGEQLAKAEGEAKLAAEREDSVALTEAEASAASALEEFQTQAGIFGFEQCSAGPSAPPTAPSTGGSEGEGVEEGGIEVEEGAGEYVPPEEEAGIEEVAPEGGGAGIEEVAPEGGGEEESSSGGVGPG